jgi:hypothetical protein
LKIPELLKIYYIFLSKLYFFLTAVYLDEKVRMHDNAQTIEPSVAEQQTSADLNKSSNSRLNAHSAGTVNNNTADLVTAHGPLQALYLFFF